MSLNELRLEEEEQEEGERFIAKAMNEVDAGRDRATPAGVLLAGYFSVILYFSKTAYCTWDVTT